MITRIDATHGQTVVEFADNGPGIPTEYRARVFEPYFTTKPEGQGTGVGLAVCLGIAEAHGGQLDLECPDEGGTRFRLRLPLFREADETHDEEAQAHGLGEASASRTQTPELVGERSARTQPRLLIVDDEPKLAEMLRDMLSPITSRLDMAANGRRALALLDRHAYELVLTDVRMPELDGPGLHRAIEERWPELSERVLFMTGDTLSAPIQTFLKRHPRQVLEKPFHAQTVRQRVLAALNISPDGTLDRRHADTLTRPAP